MKKLKNRQIGEQFTIETNSINKLTTYGVGTLIKHEDGEYIVELKNGDRLTCDGYEATNDIR